MEPALTHDAQLKKLLVALRYRLLGAAQVDRAWYKAIDALEFAICKHEGMTRKRGGAYIIHPVEATLYVLTLPGLLHRVETVAVTLMHDVMEDCGVTYQEFVDIFGTQVADGVERMSKVVDGVRKDDSAYYAALAKCPMGSIGKPADRINNQDSMVDAFTPEKQLRYVAEAEEFILPLIKTARRRFPQQELAYENAKLVLSTQIRLVRASLAAPKLA